MESWRGGRSLSCQEGNDSIREAVPLKRIDRTKEAWLGARSRWRYEDSHTVANKNSRSRGRKPAGRGSAARFTYCPP